MRLFNAFQIVAAFAAAPFGIAYLYDATFRGAGVAFWSSTCFYAVFVGFLTAALYTAIEQWEK